MKFINFFTSFNFLKNDKLSKNFYHRISAIILLISGIFAYSIFNLEDLTGIGIYSGLFSFNNIIFNVEQYFFIIKHIINNIYYNLSFAVPFVSDLFYDISYFNDFFSITIIGFKLKLILFIKISIICLMVALTLYLIFIESS
jgi:hypothetical protein